MKQEYTIKDSVLWIRPRPRIQPRRKSWGYTPHPVAAYGGDEQDHTRPPPRALRHFFNVVKYPEKRLTWLTFSRTKSREYGTSHYTVYIKKHPEGDGLAFGYYAKPLIFKHKPQNIMRNADWCY